MALSMIPLPKNSLLLPLLGVPFERALRFHRRLGQAAVYSALAHGLVYLRGWYVDPYGQDAAGNDLSGFAYVLTEISPFCDRSTAELSKDCDDSYKPGGDNEDTWLFDGSDHRVGSFMGVVAG
eukprot:COSAG06_NODE_43898_length_368_cov_0.579926_1_plen_122_part_11